MGFKNGRWEFHGHPQHFKSTLEEERYFKREQERYITGHDGICGWHYEFLTTYPISARADGTPSYPKFFEHSEEFIFPALEKSSRTGTDIIVAKLRGAGFSVIFGGFVPIKVAKDNPGSRIVLTSDGKEKTNELMENKILLSLALMDERIRPAIGSHDKSTGTLFFGEKSKGSKIFNEGLLSKIVCIDTNSKPDAYKKVEGPGIKYLLGDEAAIQKYLKKVLQVGTPNMIKDGKKVGFSVVGGAAGSDSAGLESFRDMWENAKTLGFHQIFMPAWAYLEYVPKYNSRGDALPGQYTDCTDGNGRVVKTKVINEINKVRKALEQLHDKSYLLNFKMMYPIEIDDVFNYAESAYWDAEVLMKIQEQEKEYRKAIRVKDISKTENSYFIQKIEGTGTGTLLATAHEQGWAKILQHPMKDVPYLAATDPIPFISGTTDKKRSKISFGIKNLNTNQYVAYLHERTHDATKTVERMILLQDYFNGAINYPEKNAMGTILEAYKNAGRLNIVGKTPPELRPKTSVRVEYGIPKSNEEIYQHLYEYVKNNINLMWLKPFYDEYQGFPIENCDFIDMMVVMEAAQYYLSKKSKIAQAKTFNSIRVWNPIRMQYEKKIIKT
jgi:hypothetical protein